MAVHYDDDGSRGPSLPPCVLRVREATRTSYLNDLRSARADVPICFNRVGNNPPAFVEVVETDSEMECTGVTVPATPFVSHKNISFQSEAELFEFERFRRARVRID